MSDTRSSPLRTQGLRRRRAVTTASMALASGILAAACAGGGNATTDLDAAPAPAAAAGEPTTVVSDLPTSTFPTAEPTTTAIAPTTTAATTTSLPRPTPTTVLLPVPVQPPADGEAVEPVVELGRLAIPKIGIDRTLYEGIRLPTFDLGPGHWPGTAAPGAIGNMVVGGHRTAGAADFRRLDELAPGDELIVTGADGTAHTYVVDSTEITSPFAAAVIYQTPARTATLFACHPPGSTRQRIVVRLTLAG